MPTQRLFSSIHLFLAYPTPVKCLSFFPPNFIFVFWNSNWAAIKNFLVELALNPLILEWFHLLIWVVEMRAKILGLNSLVQFLAKAYLFFRIIGYLLYRKSWDLSFFQTSNWRPRFRGEKGSFLRLRNLIFVRSGALTWTLSGTIICLIRALNSNHGTSHPCILRKLHGLVRLDYIGVRGNRSLPNLRIEWSLYLWVSIERHLRGWHWILPY